MDEILRYFPLLTDVQKRQLQLYMDRLRWWNTQINLISRQDSDHIAQRHVLHSLAIAKSFRFSEGMRILDLGTGGGLPGIPLAIYFPKCTFTLIDGTGKKIKAVQAMIEDIGLQNARAIHVRAEDVKGDFDFVVTRAVASLKELWNWAKPLIKAEADTTVGTGKGIGLMQFGEGGAEWSSGLIVLKGGDMTNEIKEIAEFTKVGKAGKIEHSMHVVSIHNLIPEPYFLEKFIVFIPLARVPAFPR